MGLDTFERQIVNISRVWFDDAEYDEETKVVAHYILDGGLYGKQGNYASIRLSNNGGNKFKWVLKELFPDYETIKRLYPKERTYKILTPLYWLRRIVRVILHPERIKARTVVFAKDEAELGKSNQVLEVMGLRSIDY